MKRIGLILLILCFATGCSSVMATKQPPKKDLSVLEAGSDRYRVIAELGEPIYSDTRDGERIDVFKFVQGYSKGAKAGRALAHGVATVYTLGLWEVVGTPIEGAADGKELQVKVIYDAGDLVKSAEMLNDG